MNIENNKLVIFILICVPFIYLLPLTSGFLVMGNDFELLYYSYKKYIFDFYKVDLFPYWSPSEASGYTLIYNPFAQFFYLPGWVLLTIHKIFNLEFTRYNYLIFTIFGISIYNIGQYYWLKLLNIETKHALITCIILTFGLKITEILRFPNAIHTFCWFSWILYGMTLTKYKTKKIKSFSIIFFSTLFILTAGYPYYIIYGVFLFFTYFIFISLKNVTTEILEINLKNKISIFKSFSRCLIPASLAFVIVSPWLYNVSKILNITRDRGIKDINFTNILNSNFSDQLGSWIFPKLSIAEGWFYNGIMITFLILSFLLFSLFLDKRMNKYKILSIYFLILYLLIFTLSKAGDSIIFNFILEKIDYLKNLRAWSRINIVILPIYALTFSFALKYFDNYIENKKKINSYFKFFIYFLFLTIVTIQFLLIDYNGNIYWNTWQGRRIEFAVDYFRLISPFISKLISLYQGWIYFLFGTISLVSFIILIENKINLSVFKKYLAVFLILITFFELFILSNIQWSLHGSSWKKTYNSNKNIIEFVNESFDKANSLDRVKGNVYYKNDKTYSLNYIDNFGYDMHTKIFDMFFNRNGEIKNNIKEDVYKDLSIFYALSNENVERIFFTKEINHLNIFNFIKDYKLNKNKALINKIYYSGNILELEVHSNISGYITFVDNWDPFWEVELDGLKVNISKFMDTYKSVKINSGTTHIKFNYNPWKINF